LLLVLDLHRLRVLREVARLGSMTAAANSLAYTQPAISHHIARLEAEAGTPLVIRHGRGVRLTEAGHVLVAHADAVLSRLADAEEEVAAIAGLRAGRVRLAAFPTAVASFVPEALSALRARAPAVTVTLIEAEPPEALAALRAGEVDVAVSFTHTGSPPDADARLREIDLVHDPVRVAVPREHPQSAASQVSLAQLREESWVAGCERCRGHLVAACAAAGFTPRITYATDDYLAVQRLVASGLAVTALPDMAFALHQQPRLVRLEAPELGYRRVTAVTPAGSRPPAVAAMLDELVIATQP
jgi:DNA-binding transcriptional LysR family regulator